MKHLITFIFLLLSSSTCFAQNNFQLDDDLVYAVVTDTDGYVNIREQPDVNSRVIIQLKRYQVFSCEPTKTNWWKVLYIDNQQSHSSWFEGFVYKDKIQLLNGLDKTYPLISHINECCLKDNGLSIVVKKQKFITKQHDLAFREVKSIPPGYKELYKIDNNWFWGTDGEIPKEQISGVQITDGNIPISVPQNAYSDLYEPQLQTLTYSRGPGNTIYIRMNNSDGAGAYTIIWIIKDGQYFGRYIDNSED